MCCLEFPEIWPMLKLFKTAPSVRNSKYGCKGSFSTCFAPVLISYHERVKRTFLRVESFYVHALYILLAHNLDDFLVKNFSYVRKVAERKSPEFVEFSSRALHRKVLRMFLKFMRIFRALLPGRQRPLKIH